MTAKKTVNACRGRGVYEIAEVRVHYTKLTHQLSYLLQVIPLMVVFSQVEFGKVDDFSQDCAPRPNLFLLPGHHGQLALLIAMIKNDSFGRRLHPLSLQKQGSPIAHLFSIPPSWYILRGGLLIFLHSKKLELEIGITDSTPL